MSHDPTPGYVYLLINYSMPGLVKVGRTTRPPVERTTELSSATGVPTPFQLVFEVFVPDCVEAEANLVNLLTEGGYRLSENREFFEAPIDEVVKLMLQIREVAQRLAVTHTESPAIAPHGQTSAQDLLQDRDPLFREAAMVCIKRGEASTSALQKALNIGYGRAARILDQLHSVGVVGLREKSGFLGLSETDVRDVLMSQEEFDAHCLE